MKTLIGIVTAFAIALTAPLTWAQQAQPESKSGLYFAVHGGFTTFKVDDDDIGGGNDIDDTYIFGYTVGGSLGYKLGFLRVEGEVAYRQYDPDDLKIADVDLDIGGDLTVMSYMGNVYVDFDNATPFTPYIGGGLGVAEISANNLNRPGILNVDDEDTVFAYKVGGGFALTLTSFLDLTLDYHYFGTDDIQFDNSVTSTDFDPGYNSHNVNGGIRFRF